MANATLRYADFIIRWRWPVLILSILMALAATAGVRHLEFSTSYRDYFDAANPQLIAHDAVENTYVKVDSVVFVVKGQEGEVFTPERLGLIAEMTEAAWQMPYVLRVDSLTNYQNTWASGDDLLVRDLVDGPERLSPEGIAEIRQIALSEPTIVNRLVSPDGTAASINVIIQFPPGEASEQPIIAAAARQLRDDILDRHPDVRIALTGVVMLSNAFLESSQKDLGTLFPLMGLFLALTLFIFLGSAGGALLALAVVVLSVGVAMGLSGYAGFEINTASGIAPIIILTVAIADAIHILVTTFSEQAGGRDRISALRESLRVNMQPVFLTSVTTAIGFLSLNYSDAPPFRDMGNICAVGALVAWGFSVTFLPAAIAIFPLKGRRRGRLETMAMSRVIGLVTRRPAQVVTAMVLISLFLALFLPRLSINDKFVEQFAVGTEFRDDSDFITENLPGVYVMDFSVSSGEEGGISNPAYLERLDAFASWLKKREGVTHVLSFTDIMKRLNRSMHGDDPAWYRLPEERDLAAQYLLLYEMSLPYGLDLNNQVDVAKSSTRLMVILDNVSSKGMQKIAADAEAWLTNNAADTLQGRGSGVSLIFSYLTQRNVSAMFAGTAMALFLISGCLFAALRSFRLGLVSLLPNLMPPVLAFGVWALVVEEVGLWAAAVTATSLGLIVDFTVHFLSKYMRGRRERNLSADDSVHYAFNMVGSALWISAFVLVAGFSALMLSDYKTNAYLGMVTSIIIVFALITDFLLLPAALLLLDRKKPVG